MTYGGEIVRLDLDDAPFANGATLSRTCWALWYRSTYGPCDLADAMRDMASAADGDWADLGTLLAPLRRPAVGEPLGDDADFLVMPDGSKSTDWIVTAKAPRDGIWLRSAAQVIHKYLGAGHAPGAGFVELCAFPVRLMCALQGKDPDLMAPFGTFAPRPFRSRGSVEYS